MTGAPQSQRPFGVGHTAYPSGDVVSLAPPPAGMGLRELAQPADGGSAWGLEQGELGGTPLHYTMISVRWSLWFQISSAV